MKKKNKISDKIIINVDVYNEYGQDNFVRTDKIRKCDMSDYIATTVTKGDCQNIDESVDVICEDIFNSRMSKTHRWKSHGFIYIFYK